MSAWVLLTLVHSLMQMNHIIVILTGLNWLPAIGYPSSDLTSQKMVWRIIIMQTIQGLGLLSRRIWKDTIHEYSDTSYLPVHTLMQINHLISNLTCSNWFLQLGIRLLTSIIAPSHCTKGVKNHRKCRLFKVYGLSGRRIIELVLLTPLFIPLLNALW